MCLNQQLTIALIVQNEEKHLAACLDSVAPFACPIVIIDSGSTDNTLAIAAQYGAQVHTFADWQGFGVQRNRAHAWIHTPWVLWLDADERLTDTVRQHIQAALTRITPADNTVFSLTRLSIAYGREIRHCGWYPDKVVRLYPTALTRYNDDLVHESVIISKDMTVQEIKGDVLHYTYDSLAQHLNKMQHYAFAWAAQRQGKQAATPYGATLRALFAMFKFYVLKRGFLDGKAGLIISVMNGIYTFLKYTQLWHLNQTRHRPHRES